MVDEQNASMEQCWNVTGRINQRTHKNIRQQWKFEVFIATDMNALAPELNAWWEMQIYIRPLNNIT
jgi:hypothetical protein